MSFALALAQARARKALPLGSYLPADLDQPLIGSRVAAIDTETTGLEGDARVIEVSVVLIRELGRTEPELDYCSLVNPDPVEIDWRATKAHGLRKVHVSRSPPWPEIWPRVAQSVSGAVWCAHNGVFDHRILQTEAITLDLSLPPARAVWLDTLTILRCLDAHHQSRSLEAACQRRGIKAGAHRAAADAMATAHLLHKVIGELAESDHRASVQGSVRDLLRWQGLDKKGKERAAKRPPSPPSAPSPSLLPLPEGLTHTREECDETVRRGEISRTSTDQSCSLRTRRVSAGLRLDLPRSAELALWEIEDGTMTLPRVVPDVDARIHQSDGSVRLGRLRLTWGMYERALWQALKERVRQHLSAGRALLDLHPLPGWEWAELVDAAHAVRGIG